MASVAHSTPARVSQRGPVTRALTAMREAEIPVARIGMGCLLTEAGPVFFDAGRRPATGELALVVMQNGELAVRPVAESYGGPEAGFVHVEIEKPRWALSARAKVALIGAVTAQLV